MERTSRPTQQTRTPWTTSRSATASAATRRSAPSRRSRPYIDDGGKVKLVGDPLYYEPLSVAFDKNDPSDAQSLSEAVGNIIDDMHADGTLSALSKKWYNGVDWTVSSASKGSVSPSA